MPKAHKLKILGAFLILLGLVLPLYSCRGRFVNAAGEEIRYLDPSGAGLTGNAIDPKKPLPPGVRRLEPGMKAPAGVTFRKNYRYFFGEFSYDDAFDWFRLAGFLWPAALVFFSIRWKHRWSRWLFRGLEPILVLESSMALSTSAIFGTKEIGFWTAWGGLILYSLGAAWSGMEALRGWKPALGKGSKVACGVLIYGVFLGCSVLSVMSFFEWFVE